MGNFKSERFTELYFILLWIYFTCVLGLLSLRSIHLSPGLLQSSIRLFRLNMMVTWMHWMLANTAFIMVSDAKNLPMERAIGQIGGKYFARYKAEVAAATERKYNERAREICEKVNGVLATQLDNQQFQFIFEKEKSFFRKGGMLWIDAVYNIFEDGNIWTWANTEDEITAIPTSPTTKKDGLCGVMDAQMKKYEPLKMIYEPLIVGHDCVWSQNTDILCMSDKPIFD